MTEALGSQGQRPLAWTASQRVELDQVVTQVMTCQVPVRMSVDGQDVKLAAHALRPGLASARGLPERPTVVLLHGFTGDALDFVWLAQHIPGDWRFVGIDLLGHGASDSPQDPALYAMPACLDQLDAVLAALGIWRAHLLGYSMGGRAALSWAARHGQRWRSVALVGASPGLALERERAQRQAQDEAWAAILEQGIHAGQGAQAFLARWRQAPILQSQRRVKPQALAWMDERRAWRVAQGLLGSLRGLGLGQMPPLWDALSTIEAPTLLITGQEDAKFEALAAQMSARLPRATRLRVMGAGHTCHLEAPERLGPALAAWWRAAQACP